MITCSATMKKEFLNFYEAHAKDVIKFNINEMVQKEVGERVTLEGVRNYYKVCQEKKDMHQFVIHHIFKSLYEKVDKKPQVFMFFDSIDDIREFHEYFQSRVSYPALRPKTSPPTKQSTSKASPSASSPPKNMWMARRRRQRSLKRPKS